MKYLLDSNIIIDHLHQRNEAKEWLADVRLKDTFVSYITYAEVLSGCHDELEWEKAFFVLNEFSSIPFDLNDFMAAAKLRLIHHFKLPDALQAALAINHQLTLITRNTKDFDPKIHKFVKIPYHLHKKS